MRKFRGLQLSNIKGGEQAVVTAIKLQEIAKKKLLTYGIGLGSILTIEHNHAYAAICCVKINGRSISIRRQDAQLIEVIKYEAE